ncbi:hypothetical protein HMPREF0239_00340 [Clostridium sp. ATCC BAA-442]|nr:hypothetical protein HMPREF0239_00340 [Clostridium sp. ATCC BAA-442]
MIRPLYQKNTEGYKLLFSIYGPAGRWYNNVVPITQCKGA